MKNYSFANKNDVKVNLKKVIQTVSETNPHTNKLPESEWSLVENKEYYKIICIQMIGLIGNLRPIVFKINFTYV